MDLVKSTSHAGQWLGGSALEKEKMRTHVVDQVLIENEGTSVQSPLKWEHQKREAKARESRLLTLLCELSIGFIPETIRKGSQDMLRHLDSRETTCGLLGNICSKTFITRIGRWSGFNGISYFEARNVTNSGSLRIQGSIEL